MLWIPLALCSSLSTAALPYPAAGDPSVDDPGVDEPAEPEPAPVVTQHQLALAGGTLAYTASAGRLTIESEDGKPRAALFHVAYVLDGSSGGADRPVTFCFNGGPGSSSVWLHLGAFGPRRVVLEADGAAPPPPYALADNAETLLDVTDLVFVDPVTTGYSRAAEDQDASEFHGVEGDVEIMGEFIRLWTTRAKRWDSPKYLAGESYGTTRACKLAAHLQGELGMYLNGIVLVSAVLDFQTLEFDGGNDLPYVLHLPAYTAAAWYHGQLEPALQRDFPAALRAAETFARGAYLDALVEGDALPAERRGALAREIARLTGVSAEFAERCDLRMTQPRFCKELLRDEGRLVGRLDSRYSAPDPDREGSEAWPDPSYDAIQGPFTAALNAYVREELGYESDLPYEILTGRVHPWKFDEAENRYLNVAPDLRRAMIQNAALEVFVASGYADLATPYAATQYTFAHLGLDASRAANVHFGWYDAGHMMYVSDAERAELKADLGKFYAR
jgi:carboxypeptidase C (cathepsin A)